MAQARSMFRVAAAALTLAALGASAQARPYQNPALPPSPYALPQPTYEGPSDDELLFGNGELHSSGQWRHWGDDRNSGETFETLFAPNGVFGESPEDLRSARQERYCNFHPGVC